MARCSQTERGRPRPDLRHHAARRRAVARLQHEQAGEAARSPSSSPTLGVDVIEAGFPIASPGDFEAVQRDRQRGRRARDRRPGARTCSGDIDARLGGGPDAARPRIHIFIATSRLHIKYKLRRRRREDVLDRPARRSPRRASYTRRRGVLARGRHAHRPRVPGRGRRRRRSRRAPPRSTSPTRSATRCRTSTRPCLADAATSACRALDTASSSASTATTTSGWRSPTRWPPCAPAPARWSARSTASASAPATPRWRRS